MARGGKIIKKQNTVDPVFGSRIVAHFVNRMMKDGKKIVAQTQFYNSLDEIKKKVNQEGLEVFTKALENVKPLMEVKARRIGGAAYQVPSPVRGDRKESLAIRWLIIAARARSNKEYHHFSEKLAAELIDAANNQGGAIKKKDDMHRMAEANKAFSHFKW